MESGITDRPREPTPTVVAQVEYSLEPEEYVECYLILWEKSLRKRMHIAVFTLIGASIPFVVLVGVAVEFVLGGVRHPLAWIMLTPFLAGSYLMVVAQSYMVLLPVRKMARRRSLRKLIQSYYSAGIIRDGRSNRVCLTATGFTEFNDSRQADGGVEIIEHKEFRVQWSVVECMDVTERLAIFTITGKGFLIVPRHAFKDEEAFLHFVHTAERLQQASERGIRSSVPADPAEGLQIAP